MSALLEAVEAAVLEAESAELSIRDVDGQSCLAITFDFGENSEPSCAVHVLSVMNALLVAGALTAKYAGKDGDDALYVTTFSARVVKAANTVARRALDFSIADATAIAKRT
jgi:hypothetical protein